MLQTIDPFQLPSLPLLDRRGLPNCSAIYFALAGERILYIGRTANLTLRWATHHQWKNLVGIGADVRIAWLECSDIELLPDLESALIREFQPELNRTRASRIESGTKKSFSVTLPMEACEALKKWAESKDWNVSQAARNLILERLEGHGAFKEQKPKKNE